MRAFLCVQGTPYEEIKDVAAHYHYLKSVVFATIEDKNTCIIRDMQTRDGYVLSTTY